MLPSLLLMVHFLHRHFPVAFTQWWQVTSGVMVLLHFVVVPWIDETVTSTLVSCVHTGPSQQVYVEIVSDKSNTPIMGANVSGSLDKPSALRLIIPSNLRPHQATELFHSMLKAVLVPLAIMP